QRGDHVPGRGRRDHQGGLRGRELRGGAEAEVGRRGRHHGPDRQGHLGGGAEGGVALGVGGHGDRAEEGLPLVEAGRVGGGVGEELDADGGVRLAGEGALDDRLAGGGEGGGERRGVLDAVGVGAVVEGGQVVVAEVDAQLAVGEDAVAEDPV